MILEAGSGEDVGVGSGHKKTPYAVRRKGFSGIKSLTMTYFHGCPSTIIGAKAFHCPVREGKEWVHLAMVVKRKLVWLTAVYAVSNLEEAQVG